MDVDSSFIYRIISGERKPLDESKFIDSVCKYIVNNYSSNETKNKISLLLNIELIELKSDDKFYNTLKNWITTSTNDDISAESFLEKLNEFNLEKYIKTIHFNDIKIPTMPFNFKTSKNYYGLNEMKNAELDFFKLTILSKNSKTIFMYNDMPMDDMAKDIEFGKKWMFAIAASLKKGLHLNNIHNLNRPFNELMLGLESWIPIYMTGQVAPYYLKNQENSVFSNALYVSEVAALHGEGLKNYHNDSMYYITNKKDELNYYKKQADLLLKDATPLMKIYTENNINEFKEFINSEKTTKEINEINNENLKNTFNNISFSICKDQWIIVSKKNNPNIHFVIFHPILRDAIEDFIAPIIEKNSK